MQKKVMIWKTKGMSRDLSVSAFNPEFSFENYNLRLSTNEGNTQMSWVNERGTASISLVVGKWNSTDITNTANVTTIAGTPIGTAIINHQLLLFTAGNPDYIYILKFSDDEKTHLLGKVLYSGNLQFSTSHPLETLVSYESELVQKVYWTDGINQPRVINIVGRVQASNDTQFDFVPTLQLQETVTVSRIESSAGLFAPGVIQYALTYYNQYGQESNIFYTSPLRFIAFTDRGGSPEERISTAFEIKVKDVDTNFDFLRIYSIQRTSLNGTPMCKRVADIEINGITNRTATYIDTGTTGDTIDPTELLYKGGEEITAETFSQKDNTLFLGNIKIKRPQLQDALISAGYYDNNSHTLSADVVIDYNSNIIYAPDSFNPSSTGYRYFNQLNCQNSSNETGAPCAGFKRGDTYRCGVQFQYKNGQWSSPFFIEDFLVPDSSVIIAGTAEILFPRMAGTLSSDLTTLLKSLGYVKARSLIVYPSMQDRKTLCQGVVCPTVFTDTHRSVDKDLLTQSSWFFRPKKGDSEYVNNNETVSPWSETTGTIPYTKGDNSYNPNADPGKKHPYGRSVSIRQVEVQGFFDYEDRFKVDWGIVTMHSPDVEFDSELANIDYSGCSCYEAGKANILFTMSDIDIQTETPTISNNGGGFIHKSFTHQNSWGIVSGLFYDDYATDDLDDYTLVKWRHEHSAYKWMVYPWHRSGSLTNDINRPSDKGVQSNKLKRKVISNLRYAETSLSTLMTSANFTYKPELFSSDEVSVLKIGYSNDNYSSVYQGNVNTVLNSKLQGFFLAFDGNTYDAGDVETSFTNTQWWKLYGKYNEGQTLRERGLYRFDSSAATDNWGNPVNSDIGTQYDDLVVVKDLIRMKYKSTPHLVFQSPVAFNDSSNFYYLPIVEVRRNNVVAPFGGTSLDALKANVWLPCGKPVLLGNKSNDGGQTYYTKFNYNYGDTYFQRYDCLKTYPFTREDENQIVEIGSFMLESHINIDGRYDKNRGQSNNINMSPTNFNLINYVYSQKDNFFSYRIMDDDSYKNVYYPNHITWNKSKQSGADVDLWTNITLASVLELDGNKGKVTSLQRFNDQLLCFQDSGISQILYNERVQISTEQGVPIELQNSDKVQGKSYLSDTVGCSNKWSMCATPAGLYFMDSVSKSIYLFNGGLTNISVQYGFNSWSKNNIPDQSKQWTPDSFENFIAHYDAINQEVLFINNNTALAWSEKMGAFTSFYNYEHTPWLCNVDGTLLWVRSNGSIWLHQKGEYCNFFDHSTGYSMTLIGNPEPQADKIFTNIEFNACVDTEGVFENGFDKFTPFLPFDKLEAWNEYQKGVAYLDNRMGRDLFNHHNPNGMASLIRKFRIWRCDIPRNNVGTITTPEPTFDNTFDSSFYQTPVQSNKRPQDRMRNPWLYLKLHKDVATTGFLPRAEVHDIIMTYFS